MPIRVALVVWLLAGTVSAQNTIVTGAGYQSDQTSRNPITFSVPDGWVRDDEAAKRAGIFAVLLPRGATLESADRVITIAFQQKNSKVPALANLDAFFRADMENTLAQWPDIQAVRWQPTGLNPDELNFRSLEMFGGKASPHRTVIIEATDGFFSASVTTESRNDLQSPEYEAFFNSIKVP